MLSFNLPDPTEQEKIRRGPHEYRAEAGVHGRYVRKEPTYQEYPKMMSRAPAPQLKDFKNQPEAELLFEAARHRWDEMMMTSIVKNKTEEEAWLTEHANDPVLTPGAYPKTMDKTPAPIAANCDGLEDYRQKRKEWREQIQASIVYDEQEEQLWLEEHAVPVDAEATKRGRPRKAVAA
jgi:hypothetical protein